MKQFSFIVLIAMVSARRSGPALKSMQPLDLQLPSLADLEHFAFGDNIPGELQLVIYVILGLHVLALAFWIISVLLTDPKVDPYKKLKADIQAATKGDKNA
jgi:hypothetical protein